MPLSHANHRATKTVRLRLLEPLLHVGFALTGVGTVLLGCILPQVSRQWHLRDKDAGLLLLVQFATSASGALLVRRHLWRTLGWGYGLFGAGALSIFLLQHNSFPMVVLSFAGYGLGLGMAMTSTNMLFGRRYPKRRGAALALLNFSWSAGAVACPLVVAQFLRHLSSASAFGLLGVVVVPFVLLPMFADPLAFAAQTSLQPAPTAGREAATIGYFALLAFLYVGIEATVGNWMSTYATRATSWNFVGSNLAVAFFWAALLLGRGVTPGVLRLISERQLYRASVVVVIGGILLLLTAHSPRTLLAGSVVTGLALAPLFPLILSLFLAEIGESRNAGWVFAVAGFGGAVLSWLTGVISTDTGSLRIALLVPGAAALWMLGMIHWRRANRNSEPTTDAQQAILEDTLEPTVTGKS
jgi:FHS family glucose/mannose:H+ symporter-like MFS transporter